MNPIAQSERKVLFIGGCHASVLAGIFSKYVKTSFITNFVEIAERRSPDLTYISAYDIVVMSPVFSDENWSSHRIRDAVLGAGKRVVTYPWLEWHGYYPNSKKFWMFGQLNWTGVTNLNFSDYEDGGEPRHTPDDIRANLEFTTNIGRVNEAKAGVDFGICDFILANYKDDRLFLTPDHPSNILYEFVCGEIAKQIEINAEFDFRGEPPLHPELLTPISAQVRKVLELKFSGDQYLNWSAFPHPIPALALVEAVKPQNQTFSFGQIKDETFVRASLDTSPREGVLLKVGEWVIFDLLEDGDHLRIRAVASSNEEVGNGTWYLARQHVITRAGPGRLATG